MPFSGSDFFDIVTIVVGRAQETEDAFPNFPHVAKISTMQPLSGSPFAKRVGCSSAKNIGLAANPRKA